MEIKKWDLPVDIDNSIKKVKEYLKPHKEIRELALSRLTSIVVALDEKAGINPMSFDGYKIELPEVDFSTDLLPKVVADKLASGKGSVKVERSMGSLVLDIVDSVNGKTIGSDIHVRLMGQEVKEAGVYIQTADKELEEDPESTEKYNLADEAINNSEYYRVVTVAILLSKVIEKVLSDEVVVLPVEKEENRGFSAWASSSLPKL